MSIKEARLQAANTDGRGVRRQVRAVYDFAVHGGLVSTINIGELFNRVPNGLVEANVNSVIGTVGINLPIKAVVIKVMYDVITPLTSGGAATIAFGVNTTADLVAAAILGTNGTAGLHDGIPAQTAATAVKVIADLSPLTMTIAVAALTAGKIVFTAEYFVSA